MKNCFITGASRGVGRAAALELSKNYDHIYILGRDRSALENTAKLIKNNNSTPHIIEGDFSTVDGIKSVIDKIKDISFHAIINNAGIAEISSLKNMTIEFWNKTFNVNVTAPFLISQALFENMPEGSSIVNILSVASKKGFPEWSSYCMSKYALDGFSLAIREELRERKIRVVNIYPGAIDTDIWNSLPGEWPLDKMMKPDQIAKAISFALDRPDNVLIEDITITNSSGNF